MFGVRCFRLVATSALAALAILGLTGASKSNADFVPKKMVKPPARIEINAKTVTNDIAVLTPLQTVAITNEIKAEWLKAPTEPFTLGPGDKLEVELLDDYTSRQVINVGPDGKIYYSLLPGIDVWGMTLTEARAALEKEFTKFLRDKPSIGLTLRGVESKRIWLLGRFTTPGVYSNAAPVTLLEAVSMAGGAVAATSAGAAGGGGIQEITPALNSQEIADLKRAFVVRKGEMIPVDFERLLKQGDLSQNIYLQADDFVYLPPTRSREIYVLGGVVSPRVVSFADEMTLVGAIASSGGTIKDAYLSHVAVVRGSLAKPQIAIIDYREVIKGHAPDVALEAQDIVYIPLKPYRLINRYFQLIANTFVTSLAINEGSNAVNENIPPTQIVVPLGSSITVTRPTSVQGR
jgi:polysaccharide biosynthesis/export protein